MLSNVRLISWLITVGMFAVLCFLAARPRFAETSRDLRLASASDKRDATSKPDSELARAIDRTIDESNLESARWGLFVMSLKDGHVLYSRKGDELFTPASNMKVYTTAVALDLLGTDFRWRTSVYAEKQPDSSGVVEGDLILYGRGAPDLISSRKGSAPSLADLVDQLYQSGVREVRGNVVGDNSYFRGELYGPGWQWNDLQWYYGAQPSALTVDANAVNLVIAPGDKLGESATVKLEHGSEYLHVTNDTVTVGPSALATIGINRSVSDNDVRVWGEFPVRGRSFGAFLSVHNPALWAATLFKQALVTRGIKLNGETQSRDFQLAEKEKFDPTKLIELASVQSQTLAEVVRETNKQSNNLYAELILRTLGKEKGEATPAGEDPRQKQQRGHDEIGVAVINSWLTSHKIEADKLAIHDGSGLSRLNLVTPQSTVRLLAAIAKTNSASVFRDSLAIAGRDGTLRGRLSNAAGRILGKTGTVVYVHSLSGYAVREDNEVLAFAIFCNDALGLNRPIRVMDEIATLIAGGDDTAQEKGRKSGDFLVKLPSLALDKPRLTR